MQDDGDNTVEDPDITCPLEMNEFDIINNFFTRCLNVMTLVFLCMLLCMHFSHTVCTPT